MKKWDNTAQLYRMRYRFYPYLKIMLLAARKRISITRLLTSRFPFHFPTSKKPASFSVELTDACDLKCLYCNNPLFANPRQFMNQAVFSAMIASLKQFKLDRIRIGGGEPTLHPKFDTYSAELKQHTRFLSIVTNGQWKKQSIIPALLKHYDLIEVSVDTGGKENYESSRQGASYERLIENLQALYQAREQLKSKAHINLRYMVRPSTDAEKYAEANFWKQYCDTVMPQYVIKHAESDYKEDVYNSKHIEENAFPKCTLPFKDLQVRVNGDIPLCQITGSTINPEKKRIIGNVKTDDLKAVWSGNELNQIREAHRNRKLEQMEICKGCRGC